MDWTSWIDWLVLIGAVLTGLVGIALTAITLPGCWLITLVAAGLALWRPELVSWWAVGAAVVITLIAEGVELAASALGAARGGATRKGAIGAVIGSIIGALAGAPLLFPIGSILGAAVGAGLGALVAERGIGGRTWRESAKAGGGAAVGRFIAVVLKTGMAAALAILLPLAVALAWF
ncbi:MAG: DUF456 domain-containing protein [Phycisphaerales bacterium]|nr:DUF456 domain-containing protein [Phycisphaerales bacterium]